MKLHLIFSGVAVACLSFTTAALIADFYGRLSTGKSRALQQAALAQLQSRRAEYGAAHPFFWGAFICVGDP